MLNKKEKYTLLISNIVAIVISLVVCVPFGKTSVTNFELFAKFIIAPILIAIAVGITTYFKYKYFQPSNKFITVSAYTPFFSYVGASLFSTLLVLVRTTNGFTHYYQWLIVLCVLVTVFVLVAVVNHLIHRWLLVFTKNELMIVDTVLAILAVFSTFILYRTVSNHVGIALEAKNVLYIIVPLVFGLLFAAFHVLRVLYLQTSKESFKLVSHKDLVANWKAEREKMYAEAEVDILYSLYSFTKKELGLEDELDDLYDEIIEELESQDVIPPAKEEVTEPIPEVKVEEVQPQPEQPVEEPVVEVKVDQPVEQPKVEVVPLMVKPDPVVVKRIVEVVNEVELELINKEYQTLQAERNRLEAMQKTNLDQLAELEKELANVEAKIIPAPVEKAPKEKKPVVVKEFKPSFEEVLNYVRVIPEVTEKGNPNETSFRFMVDNKPFLLIQNSATDYKITFLYELDDIVDLIVNTPNIVKAKSPKGDNWFKLTNKGEYTEDQIFDIIDKSHRMLTTLEERKTAAKEQARLAKLEAKIREREAAKLKLQKEKEAEQLRKQKERDAEKQKAQREKERERAKIQAQKEKEKARIKAQKEKERDAEKQKAQREKERERAKIQAQKEKEKARIKAQKEKEREKARLKAQKEREAAKLKAQKEKEKEAERLRKEKEREAAKLKAQQEKADQKAKEQAEKAAAKQKAQEAKGAPETTPKEAA